MDAIGHDDTCHDDCRRSRKQPWQPRRPVLAATMTGNLRPCTGFFRLHQIDQVTA